MFYEIVGNLLNTSSVFSFSISCYIYISVIFVVVLRAKRKDLFLLQADDDVVLCFLCFRLAVTNIVDDFSSFYYDTLNRSLAYLNDTAVCAGCRMSLAYSPFSLFICIYLYIYIYIYVCMFPRVIIIYRWRVNEEDRDHISFFFHECNACCLSLTIRSLNAN